MSPSFDDESLIPEEYNAFPSSASHMSKSHDSPRRQTLTSMLKPYESGLLVASKQGRGRVRLRVCRQPSVEQRPPTRDEHHGSQTSVVTHTQRCRDMYPPERRLSALQRLGESQRCLSMARWNTAMKRATRKLGRQLTNEHMNTISATDKPTKGYCRQCLTMPTEGKLILEVADTGRGISEEEQQKLFQPFVQANKIVYSEFGGTGLGLWISQKLVRAMKGSITCRSQLGQGSVFTVTIPTTCARPAKTVR